ncbi:MAG: alpha/beta hydrolase family protein [Candidatus Hodarchaeota archaeon]
MYKFPQSLNHACPHCGKKVGLFQQLERCAYTGEVICSKCIVDGKFSDSVADKIPKEFREKFRVYDHLILAAILFLGFFLIQNGYWGMNGWFLYDLMKTLYDLIIGVVKLLFGIIIVFLTSRLPHISSWLYAKWISKEKNKQKVEMAVQAMEKEEHVSRSKVFNLKKNFFGYLKKTNYKILFFISIACNIIMIPLYFVIRFNKSLAGTYFSEFAGIVFLISIFANILVIMVASAHYCRKNDDNKKQRKIIEMLCWNFFGMYPLIMAGMVFSVVAGTQIIGDSVPQDLESAFFYLHVISLMVQFAHGIILPVFLLYKGKPDYLANLRTREDVPKNQKKKAYNIAFWMVLIDLLAIGGAFVIVGEPNTTEDYLMLIGIPAGIMIIKYVIVGLIFTKKKIFSKMIGKSVLIMYFTVFLLGLLMLGFILFIVDATWLSGVLSSTLILFGAVVPVTFVLLKLAKKKPHRKTQPYWTYVKLCMVAICIFSTPAIATVTVTNSDVEQQFATVFGSDWESQIPDEVAALMRQSRFSAFDMFFGYDIELHGDYFKNYTTDNPRYVHWTEPNGTITEWNSSLKFTNKTDTFSFDAYLPLEIEFKNDSSIPKLPVVIFFHGYRMTNGPENVNWICQDIANRGYLVCDLNYGYVDWTGPENDTRVGWVERNGYDFPDTIRHVGEFTQFLNSTQDYYHADMDNMYFAGRSFGGWMSTVCAYGYNSTYFISNYSFPTDITVRGCLNFYGAVGIADQGDDHLFYGDDNTPFVRGSSHDGDPDYNEEWEWMNPLKLANTSWTGTGGLCPTITFQGTQDLMVIPGWAKQLHSTLTDFGHKSIAAYYPLGSHGVDGFHGSHYGQSILYYLERFLALTREY